MLCCYTAKHKNICPVQLCQATYKTQKSKCRTKCQGALFRDFEDRSNRGARICSLWQSLLSTEKIWNLKQSEIQENLSLRSGPPTNSGDSILNRSYWLQYFQLKLYFPIIKKSLLSIKIQGFPHKYQVRLAPHCENQNVLMLQMTLLAS